MIGPGILKELLDIIANVCLSVFKQQVLNRVYTKVRIRVCEEAGQSLLNSDKVKVNLAVGAYMKILEAIYLEDGKKQDILIQLRKRIRR